MDKSAEIVAQVTALVEPVLQAQEVELVDTEMIRAGKRWLLRLYIDKPGGITLDECAQVSHLVGELLDVHDLIEQAYTLEISSPGLTRALKKPADYRRYIGRLARITIRAGAGERHTFRGELLGLEDDRVKIKEGEEIHQIPLSNIARARLDFEL
ncbi:MAG: ribosome maturation factor RimP [Deltaproteobacteria bacterium]|nr:ribosome maturation factor RimP [Deltaproteobacteria bacterium]MBW1952143.1 ribosome maturation factor RimP [Deltaproteobacteria bacterium]MBW1986168.1 ribosome maturation factor RimP [Deltaproteobacteria bacterium]MBW2134922.1 ribosome maturation factor RimP [Deltaproteobacteria bacterium]